MGMEMEMEMGKGRFFFDNGIEKGTRNRARVREREMEGTKDITRSYTNLLCIRTNVYIVENLG